MKMTAFMHRVYYTRAILLLTFLCMNTYLCRAQTVVAGISSVAVNAGSFEAPDIAAGGFQYTPAGSSWTFSGGAGISDNGSGFTNCNPGAPAGTQVLFLQQISAAQQTVSLGTTGAWRVTIRVAQRGCGNTSAQSVRVLVNGVAIGVVQPTGAAYQTYTSTVYWLNSGPQTLRLEGMTVVGDNTALIDDVRWELLPRWSQGSTWQGGVIPTSTSTASIPAGFAVALDGATCTSRVININGTLTAPTNISFGLSAECVHVLNGGLLEIGQASTPHTAIGIITLVGSDPNSVVCGAMGSKFLGGMNGSRIELHGTPRTSWTQLGATAAPGSNVITLKEAVNWLVNQRIVIASTDFDMNHAEERIITSINPDGRTITLNQPLTYNHFGQLQSYSSPNGQSWAVDERAEVGLLSRNLIIEGDAASPAQGFGGHVMIMQGSVAHISNTELYRMGQRAKLGRYPFHWHLVGNAAGQYFNNNSVHHTYNRAITVHGTNNAVVQNNVCYDNTGHAIFMEDGNETGNTITGNLGLVTRRPLTQDALLPSDLPAERNASGPATYWITHPNNIVQNNRAAGSDGSGFWFAFHQNPNSAVFQPGLNPNVLNLPAGYIDNNTAHSSYHGWLVGMAPVAGDATQTHNFNNDYQPTAAPTVTGLTVYKNRLGVYSRIGGDNIPSTYVNLMAADNWEGEASTWVTDYRQVLWVGASLNYEAIPGTVSASGNTLGLVSGHTLYDGPVRIYNSHFTGFDRAKFTLFDQWGANIKYTGHSLHNTTVSPGSYKVQFRDNYTGPVWFNAAIYDVDGVFTGTPMTAILQDHPVLIDGASRRITPGLNGMESNRRYCYVEVRPSDELFPVPAGQEQNRRQTSQLLRSDGAGFTENVKEIEGVSLTMMVNNAYQYRYIYHSGIPAVSRFDYHSMNAGEYMILEIPNVPATAQAYSGVASGFYSATGLAALPRVGTLAALQAYNGNAAAYIGGGMHIRFQAPAGSNFRNRGIIGSLLLCLNGSCANGPNYSFPDGDGDGLNTVTEPMTNTIIRRRDTDVNDMSFDFTNGDIQGWYVAGSSTANILVDNLWLVRADGSDPQIVRNGFNMDGNLVKYIDLRTMCQAAGNYQLYWTTADENFFNEAKSVTVNYPAANTWQQLRFQVGDNPLWRGKRITGLRIDPVGGTGVHAWYDWVKAKNTWLYAINRQGGANTTVQRLDGGGNDCKVAVPLQNTILAAADNTWTFDLADWNSDGYTDLVGLKKQGTGSGMTEIHVMNGKDNYQTFIYQAATGLGYINLNDHLLLGDYNADGKPDIWYISHNATGTGLTEVHIMDGNNPNTFLLHDATGLSLVPNTVDDFGVYDYDADGRADLWFIKKQGAGGKTEVHILKNTADAATFNNFSLHAATILGATDANWSFDVADYNRDGFADVIGVNRLGTGSRTDVYVINGASGLQDYLLLANSDMGGGTANHLYLVDDGTRATGLGYTGAPPIARLASAAPVAEAPAANNSDISIYPNPATDRVTINVGKYAGQPVRISITAAGGQAMWMKSFLVAAASIVWPLKGITPGIYILQITPADGKPVTEKLVITK